MTLTEQDFEQLRQIIREEIGKFGAPEGRPASVLTTPQAAAYIGKTVRGFYAWAKRQHVYGCGAGRWARTKLDLGLERESRQVRHIERGEP